MNHFKRISYRNSWCQLKRSQSSLPASSSEIQIPPRIERGPTDILHALDRTVPRDPLRSSYKYHDDPFLLPSKKIECRIYALSYESGKKTAMWIHREHRDWFPKDLSDPKIGAFQPPVVYTDKSQVSEEILLNAIQHRNVLDAIDIYKLIENDVSNETKQALLELLCFYNAQPNDLEHFPHEQWFCKHTEKKWLHQPEIDKLYKFLITQGPVAAAEAYNAMICGYAKWFQVDKAWLLYEHCKKENIPVNVTTYNYLLGLIVDYSPTDSSKKELLHATLESMNTGGIRPNVRTLNAALDIAASLLSFNDAKDLVKHLFVEFKTLDIKPSLGSYYHAIRVFSRKGESTNQFFMDILDVVANRSFTMQDPIDSKFFGTAMDAAFQCYSNVSAGHIIHNILLSGDNYKFITKGVIENGYFYAYMMLVLSNSTIEEFFEVYRKIVPSMYIPEMRLMKEVIRVLSSNPSDVIVEYLPKFWSDLTTFGWSDTPLGFFVIDIMRNIVLPCESPLITFFADAASSVWDYIKKERTKETCQPFHSKTTGGIALLLLRGGRVEEMRQVLIETIDHPHVFVPNMDKVQVNELFKSCISNQCIAEALLVLKYCINSGFEDVVEMTKTLRNIPHFNDVYHDKLTELVGDEILQTVNSLPSN